MRAILFAALGACASAGDPANHLGPIDAAVDSKKPIDAPNGVPIDGPAHHDAAVVHDAPPDAFVMHPPDADTTGAICGSNAACTTTGQCCLIISGGVGLCTSGTVVGGTCLPI